MDQSTLVTSGHALVRAMDAEKIPPRLAMWVHATDTGTWKLWIVPPKGMTDKADFYRRLSKLISEHRDELAGIDASDTEMVLDTHPAAQGVSRFIKMPGLGSASFSGNRFNGFYLPDGIILRSDFQGAVAA